MSKQGYVYCLMNKLDTVVYTGVKSDLKKRVFEHKEKLIPGFTKRYNVDKLVYFEAYDSVRDAIEREKQIKAGSRKKKLELILRANPDFSDLYEAL